MNSLRLLRDPLVLVCCTLYVVNRWLVKPHLHLEFFTCWFNDMLLIPCALPPLLIVHEWLGLRPRGAAPTGGEIFWHLVLWSVLFEWIGPRILKHSTGDPLDVLAYSLGALVAYLWWQRPLFIRHALSPEKLDARVVDMQSWSPFQFLASLLRRRGGWFANHEL